MPKRLSSVRAAFIVMLFSFSAHGADWVYTVVDGDNLWDFSAKYLDSVLRFDQLRKLNNVKNPKRLQPGSWLRVPMKWIRSNAVPARVDSVKGRAKLTRADGTKESDISSGVLIHLGDTLKTGPRSSVAIVFADGTALTLHSDAEMRFDHLSAHGETGMVDSRLHLGKGRLQTRVKPSEGPGSRFEIHTPSAITAVRGTAYRAAVSLNGDSSNIEVLEGDVLVSGAEEQTLVPAGFGTRIVQGQAPSPPRKLLPPPSLKPIPEPVRELDWRLSWAPIKDAASYRVEVSDDRQLDVLLWEQLTADPHIVLPELADGDYWIRVRGADSDGLEGNSAVKSIILDRYPQPPVSLNPPDGEVMRGGDVALQWAASDTADSYRLEIATDQAFENVVFKLEETDLTQFQVTDITEPGTYYWRISAIAGDDEVGPAGVVRSWRLRPELEQLNVEVKVMPDKLIGSWRKAGPEQRYHVQLAHDSDFNELELDEVITEPEISFKPIYSQVRYLRVSVVETDDYRGPWSSVRQIDPLLGIEVWIVPASFILGLLLL